MANILGHLDPKKFKHVKSDDKTTTLQHEQGHTITILHSVLSKPMQAQLKALAGSAQTPLQADEAKHQEANKMAKGGEAEDDFGYPKSGKPMKDRPEVLENYKGLKRGAESETEPTPAPKKEEPQKFAEGTPNNTIEVADATPVSDDAPATQLDPEKLAQAQQRLEDHQQLVRMGLVKDDNAPPASPEQQQDFTNHLNNLRTEAGIAPKPAPGEMSSAPATASAPGMTAPPQAAPANAMPTPEGDLRHAFALESQGIQDQATAQGVLGNARAAILQKDVEAKQLAQTHFQESAQHIGNEIDGVIQDIKDNHIDPQNYWKDHSKLATGIGIILAGFNPTNSPNAAIDFLKKQMEMNLDAQKAELGKKNNMLSAYYHQFGNLKDAMEMTRLTQAGIVASKLDDAAAQAANPMAAAAAKQAKGKLLGDYAPRFQAFAMQRSIMNMASQGGGNPDAIGHMIDQISVLNPEQGKALRARFVPGLGLAEKEVPEKVMGEIQGHRDFDVAAKDLQQWTKSHTTLVPGTADYNTGVQKSMQLQTLIREKLLNTVYREGEQPLLDKMIQGNPANLLKNFNTMPQLKELIRSNQQRFNTLKSTYGFHVDPQAAEPQYKTVNGVKYMRGPNGEAVKVK